MAIMVHEEIKEDYWAVLPCRGLASTVTAWVEEVNNRKMILFRRNTSHNPCNLSPQMEVRLGIFVLAVRRILDGDGSTHLFGKGTLVRRGARINFTTTCGETYSFAGGDLQALIEWASED